MEFQYQLLSFQENIVKDVGKYILKYGKMATNLGENMGKMRPEVEEFLKKWGSFKKQIEEIKAESLKKPFDDPSLRMVIWKFKKTVEQPMDYLWQKLTMKEKEECLKLMHNRK